MKPAASSGLIWGLTAPIEPSPNAEDMPARLRSALELPDPSHSRFAEGLPFVSQDATVGCENEMQVAVAGASDAVDLPVTIGQSNYYANLLETVSTQRFPHHAVSGIEQFLAANPDGVWENSWLRIPQRRLNSAAARVLTEDLCNADGSLRSDSQRFFVRGAHGEPFVRVPISYAFKLALIQFTGSAQGLPDPVVEMAVRLTGSFSNDNCSPEILSAYVSPQHRGSATGRNVAEESSKRFLLSHLLLMYAEREFALAEHGQKPLVYFSPHAPVRQAELADHISDSFYRELYVNPCLSGFADGESKSRYMGQCHEVLSRSALRAIKGLRDAGIVTRNLIVLPQNSTVSLSNNGTHVSLGSLKLGQARASGAHGLGAAGEKWHGDLVIKIVEHFLPLFIGTYSAAPHRLDFGDLHPERALRFLPHQLKHQHLRMLWRGWKKKASMKVLQKPLTPVGPQWLDQLLATTLHLRGDFVPDMRLLDYLVALPSTDRSPALDGTPGNDARCLRDLDDLGIFDRRMSFYLPYKLREWERSGFSGFEGRIYSQFADTDDLAHAVAMQNLVTALASKYVLSGRYSHRDIPDDRVIESERRQLFFATAAGISAAYVHKGTKNRLLRDILQLVPRTRSSSRFRGYLKVQIEDYRNALVKIIRRDASELVELMEMDQIVDDLDARLNDPENRSTSGRLTRAALENCDAKTPLAVSAREFNLAMEQHYRTDMRKGAIVRALDLLERDATTLILRCSADERMRSALFKLAGSDSAADIVRRVRTGIVDESVSTTEIERMLGLLLLVIRADSDRAAETIASRAEKRDAASIRRA
jgi:hypothetical protein